MLMSNKDIHSYPSNVQLIVDNGKQTVLPISLLLLQVIKNNNNTFTFTKASNHFSYNNYHM